MALEISISKILTLITNYFMKCLYIKSIYKLRVMRTTSCCHEHISEMKNMLLIVKRCCQ